MFFLSSVTDLRFPAGANPSQWYQAFFRAVTDKMGKINVTSHSTFFTKGKTSLKKADPPPNLLTAIASNTGTS